MTAPGLRQIASLWVGARLGRAEAACLAAWIALGQPVRLYTYGPVAGVPDGVELRNAAEILAVAGLRYDGANGAPLQADLFRLYLLAREPGVIWVDADVYPLRRFDMGDEYLFGRTALGGIETAVLALPANSAVLADMLAFTGDFNAIPPFVKPALRRQFAAERAAGRARPVALQGWGVWGSPLLSHFIRKHDLGGRAQPAERFAPVAAADKALLGQAGAPVAARITPQTLAVHLWGMGRGDVAPGSYVAGVIGAMPGGAMPGGAEAGRAGGGAEVTIPVGADFGPVDLRGVTSIADIGGGALGLVLAAQARGDCAVLLVDLLPKGGFGTGQSAWIAPYLAALAADGVPMSAVRVVTRADGLRPCDLVCSIAGFGDRHKVKHLAGVIEPLSHADSRWIVDIRKGSGGFGFLKPYGETEVLSRHLVDGAEVARVVMRPKAPDRVVNDDSWAAIATGLAGPDGFYRANEAHSFLYIPRGRTLVVTFDNLDIAMGKREDRRPWGFAFIEKQGWSMLGVMANGWTWYRDAWVSDQFDDLAAQGFFAGFDRVVFYGASMGGYAACAFSGAAPGADVVAISPQSTVDKAVVPWETRYKTVWGADFSGKYGDAAVVSGAARRISLIYDPYEPLDAGHADRFTAPNILRLRANLLGHRLGSSLQQMGVLNPIILGALNGTLTEAEFYRALRARRSFPRYQRELFDRLVAANHPKLARQLGQYVLRHGDNRAIRGAMAKLPAP